MSFFSCNALNCVSVNNQEYNVRTEIINITSNEPSYYLYGVEISKCSGNCNRINDPYTKLRFPDVKNMSVKVFNVISRTNETYIKWHETCKCKCRLDASVCNNKQRCSGDKCRCECKEVIDKGICDKGFNWNPINCECECDTPCDVGEYLGYKNYKCRKRLIDKLVEECSKNIDEKELHQRSCTQINWFIIQLEMIMKKYVVLVNGVPTRYTYCYICHNKYKH